MNAARREMLLSAAARGLRCSLPLATPLALVLGGPFGGGSSDLLRHAVAVLALIFSAAASVRAVEAAVRAERGQRVGEALRQIDLLSANGRWVVGLGLVALVLAPHLEWASLAVFGSLSLALTLLVMTTMVIVAGGVEPWRACTIERSLVPGVLHEGDALREVVRVGGVRVPLGCRLFIEGDARVLGSTSRYVLGPEASGAVLQLEGELGAARRGEHQLPPLRLWLQDAFGLCRTVAIRRAPTHFTALPRPLRVDGASALLSRGGDGAHTTPSLRMPTEDWFRLREYALGDDARRIHWMRSLKSQRLTVRQPDEVAVGQPSVRVVLDHHLLGADGFVGRRSAELLDALVRIWLGVGFALRDRGARVELVAADDHPQTMTLARSSASSVLRLAARVRWQSKTSLRELIGERGARTLIITACPRPSAIEGVESAEWIVVPAVLWSKQPPLPQPDAVSELPFPIGSDENRFYRRRNDLLRRRAEYEEALLFAQLMGGRDAWSHPGARVVRPKGERAELQVAK